MPEPRVICEPKPGSPIVVDRTFYDRLAGEMRSRRLVEQLVGPMRSGRAWPVRAGQLFRIVAVEGPRVADFNVWGLGNPRERFWAARTEQLHRAHVPAKRGDFSRAGDHPAPGTMAETTAFDAASARRPGEHS
ncbi:MAG TPA: DUF1989 domain-containing protein [Candidatus Nitrosotalea sp.]|nr:DUF1989 domain-containing protein [Candidatus Nitrosotalea sp.]